MLSEAAESLRGLPLVPAARVSAEQAVPSPRAPSSQASPSAVALALSLPLSTAGATVEGGRPLRWRSVLTVAMAVVVAGALGIWVGLRSLGGPAWTSVGAARLLRSSVTAGKAAGAFHYESSYMSSASSSQFEQTTVGDAGASQGQQLMTVNGDTFDVLVIESTAYFRGDASAMESNLNVPASVADVYGRKWISLVSGEAPYQSVYAAVTTGQALEYNITFTADRKLGFSIIDDTKVFAVSGPMKATDGQAAQGTGILYMAASGRHLPVRYVEQGTIGVGPSASRVDFTTTFSAWGESVKEVVPSGTVPFAVACRDCGQQIG